MVPAEEIDPITQTAPVSVPSARPYGWLAAATIFLGSFLLFQVQPIIAKIILPWFGGAASIWTTCLLFFQGLLFFGYWYAHILLSRLSPAVQKWAPTLLLATSVLLLPVIPGVHWKPTGPQDPIPRILGLLAATAGLPFLLLSSTSPLIQGWLARAPQARLPYRFYALSNLASLLALLGYPVLIEPVLPTRLQAVVWSGLFAGFAVLFTICAWLAPPATVRVSAATPVERPASGARSLWLLLAAIPTILSLAVTNHLTQNVAPVPFLWILPLGVYLLSLILCFEGDRWYRRTVFLPLFGLGSAAAAWILGNQDPGSWVKTQIPFFCTYLFIACMYFHGELAKRKPAADSLSLFFLMLALGGALGAIVVALGAPYILSGNYELPIGLSLGIVTALLLEYRRHWLSDAALALSAIATLAYSATFVIAMHTGAQINSRNFYGVLRITDESGIRRMVHGTVSHGMQFLDPARSRVATTYYAPGSGIQRAIEASRLPGEPQRVGVVGLGAGTIAAYGRSGDVYRFYEINPRVADFARRYFTFLSGSQAATEIVLGDGRLALEREPAGNFDVLAIDAFSGDSIPVHLLTREAFSVYLRHLKTDGVLALHVSNSALNLVPVAARVAESAGLAALHVQTSGDEKTGRYGSDWVLAARPDVFPRLPALVQAGQSPALPAEIPVWTDDRSNLFQVLK